MLQRSSISLDHTVGKWYTMCWSLVLTPRPVFISLYFLFKSPLDFPLLYKRHTLLLCPFID